MNKRTNHVAILLFSLTHTAIHARPDFYKPSVYEVVARREQWDNYVANGDPQSVELCATHNHVVDALKLIEKPCDLEIRGPYDYRAYKTTDTIKQESMEYVSLLKEDFNKRQKNSVKFTVRYHTYECNINDLVKAVGYRQLIENRIKQEEKPDNFTRWELDDYRKALTNRIHVHEDWLSTVRDTGEEHYLLLHVISTREKNDTEFRTDDEHVRAHCWNTCFKSKALEKWKQCYINERDNSVWRILSPKSVARIQECLNRGFKGKETIPSAITIPASIKPESDKPDQKKTIDSTNNLLLGINGWRDAATTPMTTVTPSVNKMGWID